jgi:hypothetical protein
VAHALLVNDANVAGELGAARAYVDAARCVQKATNPATVEPRAPSQWMADVAARILATLAKGPRSRKATVLASRANHARAYKAFAQLLAEGRVVATMGPDGRMTYTVATVDQATH